MIEKTPTKLKSDAERATMSDLVSGGSGRHFDI